MLLVKYFGGFVIFITLGVTNFALAATPIVLSTNPPQNGLNALLTTSIEVEFDVDMDEATFTNSNFTVNALYSGRHMGTFVYDSPSRTVTFTSNRVFQISEVVTVVLTTGIESIGGEPLSQSYTWSFTAEVTQGHGVFEHTAMYDIPGLDWPMAAGDFDNDGDIDIAGSSNNGLGLTIFENLGDATFAANSIDFSEETGMVQTAADFNNDGYLDLLTDASGILLNTGDGSFNVDSVYGFYQEGRFGSCTGDFNCDGAIDAAVTLFDLDVVSVMLNLGDGTFAAGVEYDVGEYPQSVDAADFDGDGDIDLAVLCWEASDVAVLFNNGDGSFAETPDIYSNIGEVSWALTTADIDADGDNDILISNYLTPITAGGAISVLINENNGLFSEYPYVCDTRDGLTQVRAVDFDADGRLDIAAGNITAFKPDDPAVFLLWNNGAGGFINYVDHTIIGGMSWAYLFADLDGDGDIDAAWNDFVGDGILIHLSQENPFECGDANSDGRVNVADAVYLIQYIFLGGPAPDSINAGDANCDGTINLGDVVYLISYVFRGGPPPCCP
jgi:hypothetical protein